MGKKGPRRGSLAFWHRKRADKILPRINTWNHNGKPGLLGTVGFKAGMTHVLMTDDSESPFKGQEVTRAVTVVEVPPIFIYSIVAYERTFEGLKALKEAVAENLPKELKTFSRHTLAKKGGDLNFISSAVGGKQVVEVRVIAASQPWKTKVGMKKPDFFELALAGDVAQQFNSAKSILGKEVPVSSIFEEGEYVDVIGVTKGKGWQGIVKRYGVALNPMKATQARRHGGSIGAETPAKVYFSIPRPGQMGFHARTDVNKRILKVGKEAKDVTPTNGFLNYGLLTSEYILIDGSIPGPAKRPIRFRRALRLSQAKKPDLKLVDVTPKN